MRHIFALLGMFTICGTVGCGAGASATAPPSVDTHATAHRRLPNTVADVTVGIETEGATVTAVSKTLAERSARLVGYLKAKGALRISTDQVNVETKTLEVRRGPDRIVGYSGSMTVSFRTSPEKSSELIAGALDQGANTLGNVSFAPSEEDRDTARRELAEEATRIALAQAGAVAKAAGEHVVAVREITVDPQNATVDDTEQAGMPKIASPASVSMRPAVPQPIATEAGDREISITVEMRVDIAP